jgi:hypothetical protein
MAACMHAEKPIVKQDLQFGLTILSRKGAPVATITIDCPWVSLR